MKETENEIFYTINGFYLSENLKCTFGNDYMISEKKLATHGTGSSGTHQMNEPKPGYEPVRFDSAPGETFSCFVGDRYRPKTKPVQIRGNTNN
jgi:hypothetical protein